MRDTARTKAQLIAELTALRAECSQLRGLLSATRPASAIPSQASPQRWHAADAAGAATPWYRALVEYGPGLMYVHDLDGVLLYLNPAAAQALGYQLQERSGEKFSALLAPARRHCFETYLERCRTRPCASGMLHVLTGAGEERVWAYLAVRYEAAGQPPCVLGQAQDMTERVQREDELRLALLGLENRVAERSAELQRAQERFVKAFHASPDAIIITSMDGRYIDVNPTFQRLAEYSREEVIGRTSQEMDRWVNPRDRTTVARLFRERGVVYDYEARFRTKSGAIREMLLSVEGIELDGARCILTIAHDVTERRQLEREILEISERERQRIGYDLHDSLGQHLTGIAFLSKVLAQRLTARQAAEAAEANQIVEFVNQAIGQARKLARGLVPVTLETYGLVFALQELAAGVESLFHLSCRVTSDQAIHIADHAVAMHLYRMVQEAVNNAVQHGKAKHIAITLRIVDGSLNLTVLDDGLGIPAKLGERRGMGLRIMHHRARMIGAILEVRRHPHGGTCVTCTLDHPHLISVGYPPPSSLLEDL
ncbi:MAG: PAS domain S-box protein [Candidatus Tectimicrobiota bacterium]